MRGCRGCGSQHLRRVLDLGTVPAADHFPWATAPKTTSEASHPLAMDLCEECALAQLADDDTTAEEPRGIEPQALRDQAHDAVSRIAAGGWLRGCTVREFGSPHGGTWLPLLTQRGYREEKVADVVLDSFGIMHEPAQRAAFQRRAAVTAPKGVLLLQFHSLVSIVSQCQWNALRHGHFAYYSLTALKRLIEGAGMSVATAWEFDLYGGTVLVAAVHKPVAPDERVRAILDSEARFGIGHADVVAELQRATDGHTQWLRSWLETQADANRRVYAYGAASRAVALFSRAGVDRRLLAAVADASPAKQGRRMPGTDVPIISPEQLLAAEPDRVLLTLPDLYEEVRQQYPQLDRRWVVDSWPEDTAALTDHALDEEQGRRSAWNAIAVR
jgi:hypothetical protein